MELVDRIIKNALRMASAFSESIILSLMLSCIFSFATIFAIRSIVVALLKMHRSKSNYKKLVKGFSFLQKIVMKPAWDECIHAKVFCRFLIICHHVRILFLGTTLLLSILVYFFPRLVATVTCWAGIQFLVLDVPILLFHFILDRHPFQRLCHEYRFERYDRSCEHDRLF